MIVLTGLYKCRFRPILYSMQRMNKPVKHLETSAEIKVVRRVRGFSGVRVYIGGGIGTMGSLPKRGKKTESQLSA